MRYWNIFSQFTQVFRSCFLFATNVSYATDDDVLESLVVHTLPDFGPHGEGITNNNFLFAMLKEAKRFKVKDGGLEIWFGITKAENSNF